MSINEKSTNIDGEGVLMLEHSFRTGLIVLMFMVCCVMTLWALVRWERTDKYRAGVARQMKRGDTAGANELADEAHFERIRAIKATFATVGCFVVTGAAWAVNTWIIPTLIAN